MGEKKESEPVCRSVFKSGENATMKMRFTEKWIEWMNRMEKNKAMIFK